MEFLDFFQVFGYLFVILASVYAMIASAQVNSTFKKYSNQISRRRLTGAQAAERVLFANGVTNVRIARTQGHLTDHFNPKDNTIYLSDSVYDSPSTAAIGVAAHEAGHAVQHAVGYVPIKIRSAIVPVTNIGSRLSMPLIMIGLLLEIYAQNFKYGYEIALLGVFCYSLCVIFQLVTLPTEFNASHRAVEALEDGMILDDDELKGAKKTLRAAAMTYVAALAVSLMQFLRLLAMVAGGRRRE
ncbi:MAG: zinc metallopeptidase [Ruminococcaceae bacterium]|nr:zinc metallopeptidase [Oscillospiraceae bacterium]